MDEELKNETGMMRGMLAEWTRLQAKKTAE